jgi:hypothetical protein
VKGDQWFQPVEKLLNDLFYLLCYLVHVFEVQCCVFSSVPIEDVCHYIRDESAGLDCVAVICVQRKISLKVPIELLTNCGDSGGGTIKRWHQ